MTEGIHLSHAQITEYLKNGVLVVDDVLTAGEVAHAVDWLKETLREHGVMSLTVEDEISATNFTKLSSTNGSGGVLDLFYEEWKFTIATNSTLFRMTQQLWEAAYCHEGETKEQLTNEDFFRWHPFGSFDCHRGYAYIDRVGYRLPSDLAQKMGERIHPQRKKKKARTIQRSLTPHLDCCPNSMYDDSPKWRPIQCFISLSDSLEPNHGGFEAAKGFHHEFDEWARKRSPSHTIQSDDGSPMEAPCIGQYTHIRPKEDKEVMDRVQHIPVKAGCAVFWDNRIPHANSYKHIGRDPRAVIYCSFLPDIELNRQYVQNQLSDFFNGRPPRDQWNNLLEEECLPNSKIESCIESLSPLGRRLLGIDPWDGTDGDQDAREYP